MKEDKKSNNKKDCEKLNDIRNGTIRSADKGSGHENYGGCMDVMMGVSPGRVA